MRCVYGIVGAALCAAAGTSIVHAGDRSARHDDAYYAYAKVKDVQPIVRVVRVVHSAHGVLGRAGAL